MSKKKKRIFGAIVFGIVIVLGLVILFLVNVQLSITIATPIILITPPVTYLPFARLLLNTVPFIIRSPASQYNTDAPVELFPRTLLESKEQFVI